jgi:hypothetical protein
MRPSHCVRSSISVCRKRARERHWRTCSGGIQDSGNRRSANSSRSQRASSRSVFARRLRPRNARVSTGSARCGSAPAVASASLTNSQPVHASTATLTSPSKRLTQAVTAAGVASIRPPLTSPDSVSKASNVICLRCTSNPATIAIRASSAFRHLPPREPSRVEPKEAPQFMPSLRQAAAAHGRLARLAGDQASGRGAPRSDSGRGPKMRRSVSSMGTSLMLASRRRMYPSSSNSHGSLP